MLRLFILFLVGTWLMFTLSSTSWASEQGKTPEMDRKSGISGYEKVKADISVLTIGPFEFKSVSVDCPPGKRLLGGLFDNDHIQTSATRVASMGDHDRYIVVFRNVKDIYITGAVLKVTAICAFVNE